MKCLLDMDGVLVDLLTGWLEQKGFQRPNPWPPGRRAFHELFPIESFEIWNDCGEKFWAELPKMPDANELVRALESIFGGQIMLITSLVGPPISAAGKIHWIARHFPRYLGSYVITSRRTRLASPDTILIDDQEDHCRAFRQAGGRAVLVPQVWNEAHELAHESLRYTVNLVRETVARAEHLAKSA